MIILFIIYFNYCFKSFNFEINRQVLIDISFMLTIPTCTFFILENYFFEKETNLVIKQTIFTRQEQPFINFCSFKYKFYQQTEKQKRFIGKKFLNIC